MIVTKDRVASIRTGADTPQSFSIMDIIPHKNIILTPHSPSMIDFRLEDRVLAASCATLRTPSPTIPSSCTATRRTATPTSNGRPMPSLIGVRRFGVTRGSRVALLLDNSPALHPVALRRGQARCAERADQHGLARRPPALLPDRCAMHACHRAGHLSRRAGRCMARHGHPRGNGRLRVASSTGGTALGRPPRRRSCGARSPGPT